MSDISPFIGDDFLLNTPWARQLYHGHAERMPILDYHSHLDPNKIVNDYQYSSITELWLKPGEYKWRAMRAHGIPEKYVTGAVSDWERFSCWADTVAHLYGNPLYHWTHLELKRVLGIDKVLNPDTAREIYDECNAKLRLPEYSMQQLIRRFDVKAVCTANDMTDMLLYHSQWREQSRPFRLLPTWKPDRIFEMDDPVRYNRYIDQLSDASGVVIRTFGSLLEALQRRHAYFHSKGCRLSDVSIDRFYVADYTSLDIDEAFLKILSGKRLAPEEQERLKAALLMYLCELDYKTGWVQQYHIGVQTDINTTMFKLLGHHSGFDSLNDSNVGTVMGRYFNRVFQRGLLSRTIVYNLNPRDFEMFAIILGCFQDGSFPSKLQLGSAWWYLNNEYGIRRQISALSSQGLLSHFIGMATDSHCVLSYCRHEYFRRLLCSILGDALSEGKLPVCEIDRIGKMVEDICFNNVQKFLNLTF